MEKKRMRGRGSGVYKGEAGQGDREKKEVKEIKEIEEVKEVRAAHPPRRVGPTQAIAVSRGREWH
jgi:hypothetical protein